MELTLDLLTERLAVCRLDGGAPAPDWARGELVAVVSAPGEVSVVCDDDCVPEGVTAERGWRALRVRGPLDLGLTGVLAGLATALAEADVPVFAVSTYDTDYLLVPEAELGHAARALRRAGHHLGATAGDAKNI